MFSILGATLLAHFVGKFDVPTWFWWVAGLAEFSNNLRSHRKLKALEKIAVRVA